MTWKPLVPPAARTHIASATWRCCCCPATGTDQRPEAALEAHWAHDCPVQAGRERREDET